MGSKCCSDSGQEVAQDSKVTVCVKSALGLPAVDWSPGTDRFLYFGVGVDIGGDELFKSQQKKNVVDPVWNEECELPANMLFKITIFQADEDGKADVIACATLDLVSSAVDSFNGELPLEMDGNPTSNILMLKLKSGDEYPADQGSEFTVSIDNPKKKALGLEVDNSDPAKLFVIGIKKGTAMDLYNAEQIENKVEAGCFIVGVTGADAGSASESQAIEKILKKNPKQVDLVCRRANTFRISVTLPEKGDIGVELPKRPLGNSLLITNVKANGAVDAWNSENQDQKVEPWDRIVAVNGKSDKVAALQKLIKAGKKSASVVLTVVRISPEAASEEAPEVAPEEAPEAAPEVVPEEAAAP